MSNQQNQSQGHSSDKNNSNKGSAQILGKPGSSFQGSGSQIGHSSDLVSEGGHQLEQFMSYMKDNWKTILSELVAAGVTAYLTHSAKEKAKNSTKM